MTDIKADYVVVDSLRVPRDTLARIWEAWRDAIPTPWSSIARLREEIERRWREMIDAVRDPRGYAV